jgi:hypothetical protein
MSTGGAWCLDGDIAGLPCPGVEQGQVAAWGREEQRGVRAAHELSHINLETDREWFSLILTSLAHGIFCHFSYVS